MAETSQGTPDGGGGRGDGGDGIIPSRYQDITKLQ